MNHNERILGLLNTSAHDAKISLELMLTNMSAARALEVCAEYLANPGEYGNQQLSHHKAFATVARKAIKQLEQEATK